MDERKVTHPEKRNKAILKPTEPALDINQQFNEKGRNKLHQALLDENPAFIRSLLVDEKMDPNSTCSSSFIPLFYAYQRLSEGGGLEKVKILLEHGADPDKSWANPIGTGDCSLLHFLATFSQERLDLDTEALVETLVETLVKGGANLERLNYDGKTPLYDAVNWNKYPMVELLLRLGASVNIDKPGEITLLGRAIMHDNLETVLKLVEYGADPNETEENDFMPVLFFALKRNCERLVALVVEKGGDPNIKKDGLSMLLLALIFDGMDMVRAFIVHGGELGKWSDLNDTAKKQVSEEEFNKFEHRVCSLKIEVNKIPLTLKSQCLRRILSSGRIPDKKSCPMALIALLQDPKTYRHEYNRR
nr:ankyrin repeat domain-containing protein [Endozoicomonas sp.]